MQLMTFWSSKGLALDNCVLLLLSDGYKKFITIFIMARFGVSDMPQMILTSLAESGIAIVFCSACDAMF
jgi:hypothetical protein